MHRLLLLPVFFYQNTNGVYGIDCATFSYEAALVGRELDNITIRSKIFMLCEGNRIVQSAGLSFFFQIGIVVLLCQISGTFFSAITWLKNVASHFVGCQTFDFHKSAAKSSGPLPCRFHLLQSRFYLIYCDFVDGTVYRRRRWNVRMSIHNNKLRSKLSLLCCLFAKSSFLLALS
ncbi:unnamed protein product [Heligmosomoides polygyrus]|uniref:Secreted protein n=1 Tax=Heligmosomoides polygyrus TaxID=6339 RepID=A0A183GFF4_HELPZ|nr:unnamed protein product [Heligmosomoides polygyrus]